MNNKNKNMDVVCQARRAPLDYMPYDDRYPFIFESLRKEISEVTGLFEVEHVGSTAIPGAAGKGIIDIIVLYPEGDIEKTKEVLMSIGFTSQGQEFDSPFPDTRPMYLGRYRFDGDCFYVYAHVIRKDDDEVRRFRDFRNKLASNEELLKEYCDFKQAILVDGVKNSNEYTRRKNEIIKKILGVDYSLSN